MKQFSFIILLFILTGCFGVDPQKTGKEGSPMPDFNIILPDSTVLHTRDIPEGKPIVLLYISPYCPYCKLLTEDILEDMDDMKNIQFYFVTSYGLRDLEGFKKQYQLAKYSNVTIGIDTAHFIHDYFGALGVPYTAIFNKKKILNKTFMGKIGAGRVRKEAED